MVEKGRLVGMITDGDLRRNMDNLIGKMADDVLDAETFTASPELLAVQALGLLTRLKIGVLLVVDKDQRPLGVLHMHDFLLARCT